MAPKSLGFGPTTLDDVGRQNLESPINTMLIGLYRTSLKREVVRPSVPDTNLLFEILSDWEREIQSLNLDDHFEGLDDLNGGVDHDLS